MTMDAQTTQTLSSFDLDFHGLDVAAVTVNGLPATYSRKKDELIITPSDPLPNGSKFSVTVDYSGRPQPVDDPSAGGGLFLPREEHQPAREDLALDDAAALPDALREKLADAGGNDDEGSVVLTSGSGQGCHCHCPGIDD